MLFPIPVLMNRKNESRQRNRIERQAMVLLVSTVIINVFWLEISGSNGYSPPEIASSVQYSYRKCPTDDAQVLHMGTDKKKQDKSLLKKTSRNRWRRWAETDEED